MTIRGTIRWVEPMAGGFRIAVRDEAFPLRNWIWLHTPDAWWASLCQHYESAADRPTLTVTYDADTQALTSVALPVTP